MNLNQEEVLEELNKRGFNSNLELANKIWKVLAIIGLREQDTKVYTRERTLERCCKPLI